jgi:hypothetical protein
MANNMLPAVVERGIKNAYHYRCKRSLRWRARHKRDAQRIVRHVEKQALARMGEDYYPISAPAFRWWDVI